MLDDLVDDDVRSWFAERTFAAPDSALEDLHQARKDRALRVSVCLPALNEEATVGAICSIITGEMMPGLVDELLVIDSGSTDGTAAAARAGGATVYPVAELVPDVSIEPGGGKGEALWRSLSVATGDIVVWLDADTRNFSQRFVTALLEPLIADETIGFVKAYYERPLATAQGITSPEGGRVTELLVRPLLAAFVPELSGIVQPLSGEYACRRELALSIPFSTGYAVDVCLLLDILESRGLRAIAQADLGMRVHRNRDLAALGRMSMEIVHGFFARLEEHGRVKTSDLHDVLTQFTGIEGELAAHSTQIDVLTRPPMASL